MKLESEVHIQNEEFLRESDFSGLSSAKGITIEPSQQSRLAFLTDPTGLAVEQYKLLRRRLNVLHPRGGVLLITSPGPGDGKTLTSVNTSWSLAKNGDNTCLIDLDFRAPGIAAALGHATEGAGVESVLTGKCTVRESIRQINDLPLYVLGMEDRHPSPDEFLTSTVLVPFISELRTIYHWVILDLPPASPMSDVAEVLPYVDGALMVVRAGQTKRALISKATEVLGQKLIGFISNESPVIGSDYYNYYGSRGSKR
jgi:capsular exopolysaccharide synthesis family protein